MPSKRTTKEIGDEWESRAKHFLEQKEYQFLERNYRSRRNEIDLIFKDNNVLVFVEVKFRKNTWFGNPEDFVDANKLNRIMEAAEDYMYQKDWNGPIRFDIIAITPDEILHLEDVD